MVVLCWRPIVDLFRLSLSSDVYSHLFVIPLISGSLIYLRRRLVFGRTGGTRGAAISFFLLAIALVLLSRGLSSSISHEFALQLAILGFVMLIWSGFAWIFGSLAFSEAVFPLFLLVFMVPLPGFILDRFIAWLQVGSANVTSWLFYVTGAHAVRDGLYFSLPGVLIVISKECSGIRSTIALLITCMAAGYLLLRTPWARAVLLLAALPVSAAHMYTITWNVSQPTTIGNMEVKPGDYELRVEEGQSQLEVVSHGKMVAQVPCHWIQLPSKAAASQVEGDSNKVTGVEFGGKTAALDFE